MTELTVAAAAMQILNNALGVIKAARERAKGSKDNELKEAISAQYDELLSLKEVLMRLTDENNELRRTIDQLETAQREKPEPRRVGSAVYYYVGEKGPHCQVCFNGKPEKLVLLPEAHEWNGGVRRTCALCKTHFYEKPMDRFAPGFAVV
jgi:hypothetical protein